jgi:hypothetical protein
LLEPVGSCGQAEREHLELEELTLHDKSKKWSESGLDGHLEICFVQVDRREPGPGEQKIPDCLDIGKTERGWVQKLVECFEVEDQPFLALLLWYHEEGRKKTGRCGDWDHRSQLAKLLNLTLNRFRRRRRGQRRENEGRFVVKPKLET